MVLRPAFPTTPESTLTVANANGLNQVREGSSQLDWPVCCASVWRSAPVNRQETPGTRLGRPLKVEPRTVGVANNPVVHWPNVPIDHLPNIAFTTGCHDAPGPP